MKLHAAEWATHAVGAQQCASAAIQQWSADMISSEDAMASSAGVADSTWRTSAQRGGADLRKTPQRSYKENLQSERRLQRQRKRVGLYNSPAV